MKDTLLFVCMFFCVSLAYAEQQIDDFYLSGFENKGQKNWEVKGKSADINDETVAIKDVDGYTYMKDTKVNVKADKGAYNKSDASMQLKENVRIESEDGINLATDSLQWDQKTNHIGTDDKVLITKEKEMAMVGDGLQADTQMKTAVLDKNVEVKFNKKDSSGFVMITCDGPVVMNYNDGNVTFHNNVKMNDNELEMFSDIANIFFDVGNKKIDHVVVEGNVKIVRGKDITYAQKATYFEANKKVILEGTPKLIFFPEK